MDLLVASLVGIGGGFAAVVTLSVGSFSLLQRLGDVRLGGFRLVTTRLAVERRHPYR
ncbi:MAG: hypothetical protein JNL79_15205 [Myxococcales bacterium]|nr:hypothetical protein [Myxococcales bacterium]